MRPTRTALSVLAALAGAFAVALVAAPESVAAPVVTVPAACPHLTILRGEFTFLDTMPSAIAAGPIATRAWDCRFEAEGTFAGDSRWQFDDSAARFEDFTGLANEMLAAGGWTLSAGYTQARTGTRSPVASTASTWPSAVAADIDAAFATFVNGRDVAQLQWQSSATDGTSTTSVTWGFGTPTKADTTGTHPLENFPGAVQRSPGIASWLMVDYFIYPENSGGTGISSPSVVSDLKTVASAPISPIQTFVLIITGLLLTVLIGYPGYLLSGVISARWDRWFELAKRPVAAIRSVTQRRQAAWVFWIGVLVASLISAFIDPRFGINWLSVRLYVTLFASFAVFNVGAWLVIRRVLRRLEPELQPPELRLRLGSLAVLLLGVVASRLLSLEPGIVFGLVAGLVFAGSLIASRRGRVVLVGTGFAAAAGVVAWIIYSVLALTTGSFDNAILLAVTEFFGGLTIQGISTLPIALLPMATLDGADLFRWNRVYWVVTYFLASVLFIFVMVNVPGGLTAIPGDYLRWIALYVGFAILATGVWGIDRWIAHRRGAARLPESQEAS